MATTQSELYKACVKASQEWERVQRERDHEVAKKLALEAFEKHYSKEIRKHFEEKDYAEIMFSHLTVVCGDEPFTVKIKHFMEWAEDSGFAVSKINCSSTVGESYFLIRLSLRDRTQTQVQESKLYQECVQAYQNYREQKFVKECAFEAFDKHYTEEIIKDFGDKSYSDVVFYHNHKYTCGDTRYTMTHFIEWAQAKGFKVELRVFPSNTTVRLML